MKIIVAIVGLIFIINISLLAQVPDTTFTGNGEVGIASINKGVFKVYHLTHNQTLYNLSLFNTDNSFFKEINFNIQSFLPAGYDTIETFSSNLYVCFITSSLFDNDDFIEFLGQIEYSYIDSNGNLVFNTHLAVFNDDGTILHQKNNCSIFETEVNGKSQFIYDLGTSAKMVLKTPNGIEIYNLPGTLP